MPTPLTYNDQPVDPATLVTLRTMDLEAGHLGKCFGGPKSAPYNISGLVLVFIFVIGGVIGYRKGYTEAVEYFKWGGALITLILGYILGQKTSGGSKE